MKKIVTLAVLVSFILGSIGIAFAEEVKATENAAATGVTAATQITAGLGVSAAAYAEPTGESDEPTVAEKVYGKAFFGTVKAVLPAQQVFVVIHKQTKKIAKFKVSKDTKFLLRGKLVGPKALRVGDRVVVFTKAGQPNNALRVRIVAGKALGKVKEDKLPVKVKEQVKQKLQDKVKQQAKDKVKGKIQQPKEQIKGNAKEKVKEPVQDKLKDRVQNKLKDRAKG